MKTLRDLGAMSLKWVVGPKALNLAACTPSMLMLSSFPWPFALCHLGQAGWWSRCCGRLQRKQTGSRSWEKFRHFDFFLQNWNVCIWLGGWCPENEYKVCILVFQINLIGSFDMLAKERCHITKYLADSLNSGYYSKSANRGWMVIYAEPSMLWGRFTLRINLEKFTPKLLFIRVLEILLVYLIVSDLFLDSVLALLLMLLW